MKQINITSLSKALQEQIKLELAEGKKSIPTEVLQEIEDNTNSNHHTENLILLAQYIGDKKLLAAAQGLLALHLYFGDLTRDLAGTRQDLVKSIRATLPSKIANAEEALRLL